MTPVERDRDFEEDEEVEQSPPRRGAGRRSTDGWTIRPSDLTMIVAVLTIVIPLLGVAFYMRDIATKVSYLVEQRAGDVARIGALETRVQQQNDQIVRLNTGASERAREMFEEAMVRIRALEERK